MSEESPNLHNVKMKTSEEPSGVSEVFFTKLSVAERNLKSSFR